MGTLSATMRIVFSLAVLSKWIKETNRCSRDDFTQNYVFLMRAHGAQREAAISERVRACIASVSLFGTCEIEGEKKLQSITSIVRLRPRSGTRRSARNFEIRSSRSSSRFV